MHDVTPDMSKVVSMTSFNRRSSKPTPIPLCRDTCRRSRRLSMVCVRSVVFFPRFIINSSLFLLMTSCPTSTSLPNSILVLSWSGWYIHVTNYMYYKLVYMYVVDTQGTHFYIVQQRANIVESWFWKVHTVSFNYHTANAIRTKTTMEPCHCWRKVNCNIHQFKARHPGHEQLTSVYPQQRPPFCSSIVKGFHTHNTHTCTYLYGHLLAGSGDCFPILIVIVGSDGFPDSLLSSLTRLAFLHILVSAVMWQDEPIKV